MEYYLYSDYSFNIWKNILFNCLVIYHHTNPKEIEAIRDSILKYPEGKFRMSEIFAGFNNHG